MVNHGDLKREIRVGVVRLEGQRDKCGQLPEFAVLWKKME